MIAAIRDATTQLKHAVSGASQRVALDALIAVDARHYKATVVTVNWCDFEAIQYYCKFKAIKASSCESQFIIEF
jgi:predicted nucleic acid-binding protein